MTKSVPQFIVGVDVGGTNVKFGIVNLSGKIILRTRLETKRYISNKKVLIEAIAAEILRLLKENQLSIRNVRGVGMGLPGLIDSESGIVDFLPNIPGWKNVPLAELLSKKIKVPVKIENDVNLITLGEWKFGAGRNCKDLVCMTLGTGVGGGLILDNKIYRGQGFVAGEIGHMPLNENGPACNCGGWGCFERYVGNQQLQKKAADIFHQKDIRLEDVYERALKGDQRAARFWFAAGEHIGNALVGVVNLLNPRLVIIGGGVSNNLKFMKPAIESAIAKRAMRVQAKMVKIVKAQLGDDAGILGAKVLFDKE